MLKDQRLQFLQPDFPRGFPVSGMKSVGGTVTALDGLTLAV